MGEDLADADNLHRSPWQKDRGKPGPYEVRAAILDEASGALGSANELVMVPKPAAKGLALSGILFQRCMAKEDDITPAQGADSFHAGETAPFAVQVLGHLDSAHVRMQASLFRDGIELPKPVDCSVERVEKGRVGGLMIRSGLTIPPAAASGDYAVQLVLTEERNGVVGPRAIQWTSFRVK